MDANELLQLTLINLRINVEIHPLHKAMLEELCENVLANNPDKTVQEQVTAVIISFPLVLNMLNGILKSAIPGVDTITLEYRNKTFKLDKNSSFIKNL